MTVAKEGEEKAVKTVFEKTTETATIVGKHCELYGTAGEQLCITMSYCVALRTLAGKVIKVNKEVSRSRRRITAVIQTNLRVLVIVA